MSSEIDNIWKIFEDFDDINSDIKKVEKCININCDCSIFSLKDNYYTCDTCNTIQDQFIDNQAEWRYYGSNDSKMSDPTRCGMPENDLLPELSLGTVIGNDFGKNSYEMYKIRKYQKWNSTSYKERSLYQIIDKITLNASNSGISQSIIDEAKILYKQLSEQKISRGMNRNGLIASSVYTEQHGEKRHEPVGPNKAFLIGDKITRYSLINSMSNFCNIFIAIF